LKDYQKIVPNLLKSISALDILIWIHILNRTNPNVAKAGGLQSQGVKGEALLGYRKPLIRKDLMPSGFPDMLGRSPAKAGRSPKGKQHGKIDLIL
jgi:hypothetical protein